MVELRPWIDLTPARQGAATASQLTQADRSVMAVVSGTPESDVSVPAGMVEVTILDSVEPPAVVPADGGITSLGAEVLCKRDSSGRITSASTPTRLPAGAQPVAVGVTGEWLAGLDSAQAGLDGRMDQADEAIAQNAHDIDHAKTEIADAKKVAEQAAQVAGNAQSAAVQATTDAQAAQSAADGAASKADQAAANLLALAGKTGRVIRSATEPTGDDRNANNLWLNTSNGQLSQWTGSSWQVITDSRLTDAANAADQAANLAGTAKSTADAAATKATQAKSAADAASSAAQTAQAAATAAQSTAAAAQAQASSAASAAASAQGAADQAKSDAAAATGIAVGKADVLIQNAEPAASMRKASTLWIDTTGGGNKPKRWSGSAWLVVTDKAATDAAAAAASAQGTADQAVTAAAAAKALADAAQAAALAAQSTADAAASKASTADGRYTVATTNPTASDASGKPIGAVWEVRSGGTALRRYVLTAATTWTQVKAGQDFVGDKAIGQAQIGDLAVGTGQMANLSVTDAKIGTMAVGKLVAGSANVDSAVIQKLSVAIANVIQLGVDRLVAGTGTLNEATAKKLWANIATFGDVTVTNQMIINTLVGKVLQGGMVVAGGGASMPTALLGPASGDLDQPGDRFGLYLNTPGNAGGKAFLEVTPDGPALSFFDSANNTVLSADKNGVRVPNRTSGGMVDLSLLVANALSYTIPNHFTLQFPPTASSGTPWSQVSFFRNPWSSLKIGNAGKVSSPTGRLLLYGGVTHNGAPTDQIGVDVYWGLYTQDPSDYAWNETGKNTYGWSNAGSRADAGGMGLNTVGMAVVNVQPNVEYWVAPTYYTYNLSNSTLTRAITRLWMYATPTV